MINISDIIMIMVERNASDLHLTPGLPPMLRIDGEIIPTPFEKLTPDTTQKLIYSLLTDAQREKFESTNELDLSFGVKDVGRMRMNVFRQRGAIAAALRSIPAKPKNFEELGLPKITYELAKLKKGLILITGPTGTGKSTTLASIVDYLNNNRTGHIITIEDPIEYIHHHKKCIINQREIGTDSNSFQTALKYVLREDPDVILVGEMRDIETIQYCLIAAETGHLVLSTLHTTDCPTTINRIIDVFPSHQQQQVRVQLSMVLQAIYSQMLLPKSTGVGRVLACEVLIATPAVRNLIREGKIEQLYTIMQTSGKFGMQTMNMVLADLYMKKLITKDEALSSSNDPEELKKLLLKASPLLSAV